MMDDLWVSAEMGGTSIFIPPDCSAAFSPSAFKLCLAGAKQPRVTLRCGSATEIGEMRERASAVLPLGSYPAPPGSRCKGTCREKPSKGREDAALLALHSTQPCYRYRGNTGPKGGQRKAGKQLAETQPGLQKKAVWRKFQPQFRHF